MTVISDAPIYISRKISSYHFTDGLLVMAAMKLVEKAFLFSRFLRLGKEQIWQSHGLSACVNLLLRKLSICGKATFNVHSDIARGMDRSVASGFIVTLSVGVRIIHSILVQGVRKL